jgi:hypothetical protein
LRARALTGWRSAEGDCIRLLKGARNGQGLFLYLVLDRSKANLALARHSLKRIESDISI